MQIAIVLYPGLTALDAVGPYEVLWLLPDAEVRFAGAAPGPVVADSGVLIATAAGVDNARSSAAGSRSTPRGARFRRSPGGVLDKFQTQQGLPLNGTTLEPAAGSAGLARHGASGEQDAGMKSAPKGVH